MYNTKDSDIYNKRTMGFKFSNKINHKLFTENLTKESCYILGLLWADGTISKKGNSISIECLKEDVDSFYPIFKTVGDFNYYTRQREGRSPQSTLNCSSLELSTFLKENDYTNKSLVSPNKILKIIPENLQKYFYLGWSDGDGCFYISDDLKTKQYVMSGTYNQDWSMLEDLCKKLDIFYIINKFKTKKGHSYSRFLIARNDGILSFGNFIYDDKNDLGLKRKFDKFNSIKNYITEKKTYTFICYKNDEKVMEFNSLKSASDWLNKGRYVGGSINDSTIGRQKTAYGYKWEKIRNQ
jgi:hypothetical protein